MNTRWSELAEECWDMRVNEWHFDQEMFAELIIKECADLYTHDDVMAPVGQSAYGEAYQDGWIEGTKAYKETILEHFGVESEPKSVGNTLTFMTRAIFNVVAKHQEINGGYFIADGDVDDFVGRLAKVINSTFEPLKPRG